jgi:ketosteroid isomerase-like protein
MTAPLPVVIQRYLQLLESFETAPAAFAQVFHPAIEQTEYPNLLTRALRTRTLPELLRDAKQGKALLAEQRFTVRHHTSSPTAERVVVEADWRGDIGANLGPFRRGQQLRAHFCMVFELRDGLIFRQRNYDCFEPFEQ